ncbi:MAG: hypothetical protein E7389_06970 [Ruminococcaceae bacterium]|nr:hypothetical protein [Oscillospiraceae bacterium]
MDLLNVKCKMMGCKIFVVWAICDDVGDDAHIVPKFSPHPSFTFGKTHLPPWGKACRGGNLPPEQLT